MEFITGNRLTQNIKEEYSEFEMAYRKYEDMLKSFYLREEGESLLEKILPARR